MAGGWLTARLSSRDDERDVQALAGLGFLAGPAGVVAWFVTQGWGPLWYALAIPVTGVIATLTSGRLARRPQGWAFMPIPISTRAGPEGPP